MSRLFFISLISQLIFINAKAQHQYIPIQKDSTFWIIVGQSWRDTSWPPKPDKSGYAVGWMDGTDTIINGRKYNCYFGDWSAIHFPLPLPKTQPAYWGNCVREDTLAKKVWYLRNISAPNVEELLYDFNLKKGDTITDIDYLSPTRLYPDKAWVHDVDSVYWVDGTWRYRWYIMSKYGSTVPHIVATIIEGMGYTTHFVGDPLEKYHTMGTTIETIACYKQKNKWVYSISNPWNVDCDTMLHRNVLPIDIDIVKLNNFPLPYLYPNPVSANGLLNVQTIEPNMFSQFKLVVYNSNLQIVINTSINSNTGIDMKNYNLPQGLYLFMLFDARMNVINRQKMLIQ